MDLSFTFHKNKKWYFSSHTVNQYNSLEKQLEKKEKANWTPTSINLKVLTIIVAQSRLTLCDPMDCSMPGFPVLHPSPSLPKLMSTELVMPSNYLVLCHSLLPLPSIFPSIRVFCNELALQSRWPKYWSFSFSMSLSNEYLGLISFRIHWFDPFAVQGTLKSLLQHHSSKSSILWHSAFFMGQLLHPYMTVGKTIALTIQSFVGKVMSLIFNKMSRFVIAFLPRSKCLLISWLQPSFGPIFSSFNSVAQSCLTFCDSMNHSMPGLPVHHQLPEFTQTHAHWISDASQPSHPLSSPSPPALNLSHHQDLF